MKKINVMISVDVIAALSNGTLEGNLHIMDNSPLNSDKQGTPDLCTYVWPGATIQWAIRAVDLQTPALIKDIKFISEEESKAPIQKIDGTGIDSDHLMLDVWEGIVPDHLVPGKKYPYRLDIHMFEGVNSILYSTRGSLKVPAITYQ